MRKGMIVLIVCALLLGMYGAPVQAVDAPASPGAVIEAVYAAVEAQDLDAAGALLADDVVLVIMPPPPGTNGTFVGKEAVLDWYQHLINDNTAAALANFEESGNRVTLTNVTWMDGLPIDSLEFDGAGIVQDGLVKTISWVMTPATVRQLDAAIMHGNNVAVVERYLEDIWNQANLDLIDEVVAEDFVNHSPRPGMGTDREALREDIIGFHETFPNHSVQFRLDDLIVTENTAVARSTMMMPGADGTPAQDEGETFIIILRINNGQISERWAASTASVE